jgi:hypothetical protein
MERIYMLKQIVTLLAVTALTVSAFAQSQTNQEETTSVSTHFPGPTSAKGFRIALVKPFLEWDAEAKADGFTFKSDGEFEKEVGLSLGFAYLPIRSVGFTVNASYLSFNSEGESDKIHMLRVDGNVGYAFNEIFSLKGGFNVSDFTNSELNEYKPSVGLQFGTGIQINKNFGFDVSYVAMRQTNRSFADYNDKGTINDPTVNIIERGVELALHATF